MNATARVAAITGAGVSKRLVDVAEQLRFEECFATVGVHDLVYLQFDGFLCGEGSDCSARVESISWGGNTWDWRAEVNGGVVGGDCRSCSGVLVEVPLGSGPRGDKIFAVAISPVLASKGGPNAHRVEDFPCCELRLQQPHSLVE
ncbi:hypothetical protein EDB19DRAFT_1828803 [Suillus lakei]|nr:hypothetical protein EDB19DRAFT_1828803 [Suillus lakei]